MHKLLKIYFLLFKLSAMSVLSHKDNFYTWIVVHTVSLLTMLVFFSSVFSKIQSLNGWSQYQTVLVLGIGSLISGIGSLTFFPFMYEFWRKILKGEFDSTLVKPASPLFLSAFSWIDVEDIMVIPNAILLIVFALYKLSPVNLFLNIIVFSILLICSMVLLFSIMTLIQSLAFKHVRVNSAIDFYWSMVTVTRYPAKAMKNISVLVWIMVFPIALISSVPAEVLFGRYDWPWIISSIVLSFSLFIFSRWVFYQSLKSYSSASS